MHRYDMDPRLPLDDIERGVRSAAITREGRMRVDPSVFEPERFWTGVALGFLLGFGACTLAFLLAAWLASEVIVP